MNLKNKNILITGGTSGLGLALSKTLIELGAKVAIVARTKENIDKTVEENPEIIGIQGDVSKKENIHTIAGVVSSRLGEVDILFNVASYLGETPLRLLIDTECEDFEDVLRTNLLGPFRLTKALLPNMLFKGQGLIVNISSDAAINAYPTWGSYATSKAAVDHLSRIFNEELKDKGVRFLSIDPGDMNTPMHFNAIPDADPEQLRKPEDSAERLISILQREDFSEVRRSL